MRTIAGNQLDIPKIRERHSLLLKIVLPTGLGIAAGIRTSERLDTSVYPLMPLQMPARRKSSSADMAQMGFRLSFCGTCRPVLPL